MNHKEINNASTKGIGGGCRISQLSGYVEKKRQKRIT